MAVDYNPSIELRMPILSLLRTAPNTESGNREQLCLRYKCEHRLLTMSEDVRKKGGVSDLKDAP